MRDLIEIDIERGREGEREQFEYVKNYFDNLDNSIMLWLKWKIYYDFHMIRLLWFGLNALTACEWYELALSSSPIFVALFLPQFKQCTSKRTFDLNQTLNLEKIW